MTSYPTTLVSMAITSSPSTEPTIIVTPSYKEPGMTPVPASVPSPVTDGKTDNKKQIKPAKGTIMVFKYFFRGRAGSEWGGSPSSSQTFWNFSGKKHMTRAIALKIKLKRKQTQKSNKQWLSFPNWMLTSQIRTLDIPHLHQLNISSPNRRNTGTQVFTLNEIQHACNLH